MFSAHPSTEADSSRSWTRLLLLLLIFTIKLVSTLFLVDLTIATLFLLDWPSQLSHHVSASRTRQTTRRTSWTTLSRVAHPRV